MLLLSACGGTSSVPDAAPTPEVEPDFTMLRASGRRIVNEAGQVVRLRGLNLGGWLVKEGYILHFPGKDLDAPSEIDRAIVDLAGPDVGPALVTEWREQWIAEADLAEIRALGFNSVRLPLHYALLWDLENGTPRPEGFAFLDRVVDWCERHRLWSVSETRAVRRSARMTAGGRPLPSVLGSQPIASAFHRCGKCSVAPTPRSV
jgi:hypothetical protein